MPVALASFETEYFGSRVQIHAGEWVIEGHEIHRRFPKKFGPDGTKVARKARRRTVARTAWPVASLTQPVATSTEHEDAEIPELRASATPTVTVKLSSFARETIGAEIAWSRELLETYDAETGGWLFGRREGGVWNLSATRLGAKGERRHEAVLHDYSEAERAADQFRSAESGFRFLGSIHTHPYWDSTKPSSSDRRWALDFSSWRELDAGPFGLLLIVTPDRERGWSRPHFHGWATRRTSLGTPVIEPARIVE